MDLHKKVGFFYGYVILGVVWLIYFANVGFFLYGTSAITAKMVADSVIGPTTVGIAVGLWTVMQGVCGPLVGRMIARRGVRLPFISGNALLAAATLLIGLLPASPILFVFLYGGLVGTGMGVAGILTCQSAVNEWFDRRKPPAMAVALSSGAIGGFVLPLVIRGAIALGGWRYGWFFVSAGCAVLTLVSYTLLVDRPSDIDEVPDGVRFCASAAGRQSMPTAVSALPDMRKVWHTSGFLAILLNYSTRTALYYSFSGHMAIYLISQKVDYTAAVFVMSLVAISSLAARLATGVLADRLIASNVLLGFGNMLMAAGTVIVAFVPSIGVIFAGAVVFGIGGGFVNVALPLTIAGFYGSSNFAVINGWITPVNYVFGALGPLVTGYMAVYAGGYFLPFVVIAALAFTGGVAAAVVKRPQETSFL